MEEAQEGWAVLLYQHGKSASVLERADAKQQKFFFFIVFVLFAHIMVEIQRISLTNVERIRLFNEKIKPCTSYSAFC